MTVDGRRIMEHRHFLELALNRKLTPHEIVHHIDHNKLNNYINNLILLNRADHFREHSDEIRKGREQKLYGSDSTSAT